MNSSELAVVFFHCQEILWDHHRKFEPKDVQLAAQSSRS